MEQTRNDTIMSMVPLVRTIVNRIAISRSIPYGHRDDMISDGVMGLITAVDRFDPSYGTTITQYAKTRIEGEILDGIRRTTRVRTAVNQKGEREVIRTTPTPLSLDRLQEGSWDIADRTNDLTTLEDRMALLTVLDKLPHDQRDILTLHAEGKSVNQIGHCLGVSHHTAKKRLAAAVRTAQRIAGVTHAPIKKNAR